MTVITLIFKQSSFTEEPCPKGACGTANSVDPDQTATVGAECCYWSRLIWVCTVCQGRISRKPDFYRNVKKTDAEQLISTFFTINKMYM